MIRYELSKLLKTRANVAVILVCIAAALLVGAVCSDASPYNLDKINETVDYFENDYTEALGELEAKRKIYLEYIELNIFGFEQEPELPPELENYDEFLEAYKIIRRKEEYRSRLDTVIGEANKYADLYENAPERSTDAAINRRIADIYSRNRNLRISKTAVYGTGKLFAAVALTSAIFLVLCVFLGVGFAFSDRRIGVESILFASKNGRRKLRWAKTAAIVFSAAVLGLLMISLTVTAFAVGSGFSAFSEYLQTCGFFVCPWPITVFQSLLIIYAFTVLSGCACGTLACFVGKTIKNQPVALLISFLILLGGYVLHSLKIFDQSNPLNVISPFSLCDGNRLFAHYYGIGIFGFVVPGAIAAAAFHIAVFIISAALYIAVNPSPSYTSCGFISKLALPRVSAPKRLRSAFGYECFKQLVSNRALLLVVPFIALKIIFAVSTANEAVSFSEELYRNYMYELQGDYTVEKAEYINQELENVNKTMALKDEMTRKYNAQEITRAEMSEYMIGYYDAEFSYKALTRVSRQLEYVKNQIDSGKYAKIVYDTGWNTAAGIGADVITLLLIITVFCGIFADEKRAGTARVAAVYDLRKFFNSKLLFCVLFAVIIALIGQVTEYLSIASSLSLPMSGSASASVSGTARLGNLPLWLYPALASVGWTACCVSVALITAAVSYLSGNKLISFLVSAAVSTVMFIDNFNVGLITVFALSAVLLICMLKKRSVSL